MRPPMKRNPPTKKLSLDRSTIRPLSQSQLQDAQGGVFILLITATIAIYQSIKQGCGSDPQSDAGGCTTQSFSG